MRRFVFLSMMAVLLLCLAACAAPVQDVPELLEPVGAQMNTVQVKRGDIYEIKHYNFAVAPQIERVLYSADGTLDEVCVIMGQTVKEGDVLLRMDVKADQEKLDALNAHISYTEQDNALSLCQLELDVEMCEKRMGENRDYAYGTKKEQERINEYERLKEALVQEQERQELQMQQLNEERRLLQERIAHSELLAPCDGQVVYIAQIAGESARAGSTAIALSMDTLMLKGEYLSEAVINAADEMTAMVGEALCEVEYVPMDQEEYISLLLSGAEMNTSFNFVGDVPQDAQAGDYVLLLVKTQLKEDVLYLPPNVLESDASGYYVYLADGNGGRERAEVKIGNRVSTAVEITEGLKEGDEVYVP